MNFNINQLMAQANKVQKELETLNKAIEETEYTGSNGSITVKANGKCEILSIECSDPELSKDQPMFLDMTMLAINDVMKKINAVKKEKMGKYTGGHGSLF